MFRTGQRERPRPRRVATPPLILGLVVSPVATTIAALTLATAPPAAAISNRVWDRVAACESAHHWHIRTGNGYFGGLQFAQATWVGLGGGKYARRADLATRVQQIAVARRVLAAQGPHAWPVCGKRAHLTRANGGATSSRLPTLAGRHPLATPHHKHHKVGHHKVGHHKARHARRPYRVHRGDTLSTIAIRFHVRGGWPALWHANRRTVRRPGLIRVGQLLHLPR